MPTSERPTPLRVARSNPARRLAPAAPATIPVHQPHFAGHEWRYLRQCLDSGWVSAAGPFVGRFERAVAEYVGARHAVATVTGSAALHVALQLVGVRPGDEVIVPDLTFIAPLHAVRQCGAGPVLIDADPQTWQIDTGQIEAFLREECVTNHRRTTNRRSGRCVRALIAAHLLGLPCAIERVMEVARRHGLAVIEDAAQAMGVRAGDRHVGTFGDVGVLSFNGNKIITAGGGGMLLTGNDRQAGQARRMIRQASPDTKGRPQPAFNYRLSSVQAALGLAQLEQLDRLLARHRVMAARYGEALTTVAGILSLTVPPDARPSYWLYPIRIAARRAGARDEAIRRLAAHGVEAKPLWRPMHTLSSNRDCHRRGGAHAARLYAQTICLPCRAGLTDAELERCLDAVRACAR
jgi:perosamine synthetase